MLGVYAFAGKRRAELRHHVCVVRDDCGVELWQIAHTIALGHIQEQVDFAPLELRLNMVDDLDLERNQGPREADVDLEEARVQAPDFAAVC